MISGLSKYINREEAIKRIKLMQQIVATLPLCEYVGGYSHANEHVLKLLASMPAADVQPVKHGRWIPQGNDMWLCSNCKENIIFSMSKSDRTEKQRYCTVCGARMDGGEE